MQCAKKHIVIISVSFFNLGEIPLLPLEEPLCYVVLQGNTRCNLSCDYCYLTPEQRSQYNLMAEEDIEVIFRNIFKSSMMDPHRMQVLWHCGEPLTAPISYYKSVIHRLQKLKNELLGESFDLSFAIQTNGTLINQEWCDFFRAYDILIGISSDGPEFLHNLNRKNWQGEGAFARVLRGIKLLKQNQVFFQAIAVVTPDALEHPEEFINFFIEQEVPYLALLPQRPSTPGDDNILIPELYDRKAAHFLKTITDIIDRCHYPFELRPTQVVARKMFGYESLFINQRHPFVNIAIDTEGNFTTYSSDLLSLKSDKYGDFILGNLLTGSLDDVFDTEKFKTMNADVQAGNEICKNTCEYYSVCDHISPAMKYFEHNTFVAGETFDCRFRQKMITDILLDKFEALEERSDEKVLVAC